MIYFRDKNGNEQLIAGMAGAGQTITQSITNGVTDKAPSSDAVYDYLAPVDISSTVTAGSAVTIRSGSLHVVKSGKVVNVSLILDSISDTTSQVIDVITGLPTPKLSQELTSIAFVNNNLYYIGMFFDGRLRMYERASGFIRIQFTYIAA